MSDSYKENLERFLQGLVPQRPSDLQKMEAYAQPNWITSLLPLRDGPMAADKTG